MWVCLSSDFEPYDGFREEFQREHKEILGIEDFLVDGRVPDFDDKEDFLKKVYDGLVDVPVGFAFDEHWILVGNNPKPTNVRCGSFGSPVVKYIEGCLRLKNHAKVMVDVLNPKSGKMVDYSNSVAVGRVFHSCDKPECPSCYLRGYAVRSANRAGNRLEVASLKFKLKVEHMAFSVPQDEDLSFEDAKRIMLAGLKVRGVVGGCWVYHHFRYRNPQVARKTGLKVGWFRSPHFHVLGFIRDGFGFCRNCSNCYLTRDGSHKVKDAEKCMRECDLFMARTHRAFKDDGSICVVMDERKTVVGSLWYELSHASIRRDSQGKRHQIVNWFGNCSKHGLKMTDAELKAHEKICHKRLCPICGEPFYRVRPCGTNMIYADWLRFMRGFKHSQVFIVDAKDCNGDWLWESVYDESEKRFQSSESQG